MGVVTIRDAEAGDAEAIAALLGQLGYPASGEQVAARLRRLGEDPASRMLVAVADSRVLGLAGTHVFQPVEHDEPACVMTALVVADHARGTGVGARLVEAVEQEARRRGCFEVTLNSGDHRVEAHEFYRHNGYTSTGRRFVKVLRGK